MRKAYKNSVSDDDQFRGFDLTTEYVKINPLFKSEILQHVSITEDF